MTAIPNSAALSRTGTVTVADQTVTITQPGVACTFAVAPLSTAAPVAGGSSDVTVTAPAGCDWVATTTTPWLTVTAGASGSGDGTVTVTAAANPAALERIGTVTVAGQTVTFTQPGVACSFTVAPLSLSLAVRVAGCGCVVSVTSPAGCAWSATTTTPWLTVTAGTSGSGDGTVTVTAAANPMALERIGTVTVAGQTVTFTQPGVACSFVVAPLSVAVPVAGGSSGLTVTTPVGCAWVATISTAWLTVTAGASGTGDGTVSVTATENTAVDVRNGTVTVAGQTVTFSQPGAACSFTVNPVAVSATAGGGTSELSVKAQAGCGWTATSNTSWLTITGGASGFGNGTVSLTAASNTTGQVRVGTATVPGQTVTVTQDACAFVIMPESVAVPAAGGSSSIAVTTTDGCAWTANSNASWLTITGGTSGFGSGTVGVDAAANSGSQARTGTLTVAGETVTFTQDAP